MGVPNSEVGYTPAMPRREDHEVHKDMWWQWTQKKTTKNVTTDVVVQQHSRKFLKMGILMPETCWVSKKKNKSSKWHLVDFLFFSYHNDARSNKHQILCWVAFKHFNYKCKSRSISELKLYYRMKKAALQNLLSCFWLWTKLRLHPILFQFLADYYNLPLTSLVTNVKYIFRTVKYTIKHFIIQVMHNT